VTAAYHTICSGCAGGSVALARLGEGVVGDGDGDGQTGVRDEEHDGSGDETDTEDGATSKHNNDDDGREEESGTVRCTPSHAAAAGSIKIRACAICVREPALPDEGDEAEQVEKMLRLEVDKLERRLGRSLKLREKKNLERKVQKRISEEDSAQRKSRKEEEINDAATPVGDAVDDGQEHEESQERQFDDQEFEEDSEVDDPFLAAVGGADKLLTGEAYRRNLLEQQQAREAVA